MRLGSHLSITKGLDQAAEFAASIGANIFQFFTRNPRGGAARRIGADEIGRWVEARRARDVYPVIGHLPYTVNLAAAPGRLRDFAAMVVEEDLRRVGSFGGEILVSHPGHYRDDRQDGLKAIASVLEPALTAQDGDGPVFCLETMALQGGEIGSLEDLAWLIQALGAPPNLGVCLDSAHLFAAGWDLRTSHGCDALVTALEQTVGLERVKCMHLNDSKVELAGRKDRHACIGAGRLGREGITAIVNHPFLSRLPMVLETPVEKYEDYGPEIALVKGWAGVVD